MPDLRFLLKVSRPRFWMYTLGPYLIGLIAGVSGRNELNDLSYLALAIYFIYPANLLIYGVNDIYDYETDRLNRKKTGYENLVEYDRHREIWVAIVLSSFGFFGELFFSNTAATVASLAFILFSIFYSAPPIRAKTKPFLDSTFNILYVMPGVFAYALVTAEFPPLKVVIAAGLWTAAMHAYSAIPDIEADREAGLKTIATVCGPYLTLAICAALYLTAAIISFEYLGIVSVSLGFAYIVLMLASVRSYQTGRLFKLYMAFPLINIIAGFVLFWEIALSKLF